jgi:hypothetical protein
MIAVQICRPVLICGMMIGKKDITRAIVHRVTEYGILESLAYPLNATVRVIKSALKTNRNITKLRLRRKAVRVSERLHLLFGYYLL